MGSFGNVVMDRLPKEESLGGRSHCDACGKTLSPLELIPVLSWVTLRGRCSTCKKPISAEYTIIEAITGALFVFALAFGEMQIIPAIFLALTFWAMFLIAVIDLQTSLIADVLTFVLTIGGIGYQWSTTGIVPLGGLAIGVGFIGALWSLSRGRWVGSGDIFLAGSLGVLLGWQLTIVMLFLSYIIGALVVIILLLTHQVARHAHIPFGPFLIGGAFVSLIWGEQLLNLMF